MGHGHVFRLQANYPARFQMPTNSSPKQSIRSFPTPRSNSRYSPMLQFFSRMPAFHSLPTMSGTQSFYCWLLQLFLLSGLFVFFLWLSLRPSDPSYTIVDVSVVGADNSTVFFGLEISNRNRGGGVYYSNMNVSLYVLDESVGRTTIPPFHQGHGRTARVRGGVSAGRRLSGAAQLRFELTTVVRYKVWWWRSRLRRMDMQGSVYVGKDGKVSGKNRKVKMHHSHSKWRSRSRSRL